ncbi:hypothetical protein NC653_014503 [Populus alba x Populus x berolinensis]|uniref:Uncharacterized protein n=1 Tax=Populus alba x Populus x berolinensis TaxID=444605 RepID=A0AAD6QY55_9ROSI|nr:hypothetical protein NC653_014503 [Populus alba x Populus x berolinensis]
MELIFSNPSCLCSLADISSKSFSITPSFPPTTGKYPLSVELLLLPPTSCPRLISRRKPMRWKLSFLPCSTSWLSLTFYMATCRWSASSPWRPFKLYMDER